MVAILSPVLRAAKIWQIRVRRKDERYIKHVIIYRELSGVTGSYWELGSFHSPELTDNGLVVRI